MFGHLPWLIKTLHHKPGCTTTEDSKRLEILDLERRGIVTICVAKTKALISCTVIAQLIWPLFSHVQKAGFLMTLLIFMLGISEAPLQPYQTQQNTSVNANRASLPFLITYFY